MFNKVDFKKGQIVPLCGWIYGESRKLDIKLATRKVILLD